MGVPGNHILWDNVVAPCGVSRWSSIPLLLPLLCRWTNNEPQQTRKEGEIDKKNYHTTMASKLYFLGMTMYHFLSAMVDGPGYLPLGWKPKEVLKLYQIFLLFE